MNDFEEQIEEKYLLLKNCMKYTFLKMSYIQLFLPGRVFVLMLPKCIKFESSDGFITQGSCGPGPQVKLSP